jgi:hypothetical protein
MAHTHQPVSVGPRRSRRGTSIEPRQVHKIRYTTAEWAILVERARACGRRPAQYVRDVSLGAVPRANRHQPQTILIHELGRVGTALTQLAFVARQSGALPEATALEAAVHHLLEITRAIDQPPAARRKVR